MLILPFALGAVKVDIPWEDFIGRHDPFWEMYVPHPLFFLFVFFFSLIIFRSPGHNVPTSWEQGGFIGNGLLGALVMANNSLGQVWRVNEAKGQVSYEHLVLGGRIEAESRV